ncbi:MFS transporter [Paenarthrobacter sp. YIM B13468]|uniref:MFS transporter n=1 Tax=Paenarthrobacter sp. YIM B13468 TaxID=3366295 RepID=UPI0036707C28
MNKRAWTITIMLILFQIIAFADKAVLGLVAQQAIPDLGISTVEFGFIGSAFFFLYAIASVLLGLWAGKVPIKWVLVAMGLSWAVLQFPMFLGGGAAVLLVTRILLGAAEGPATAMSLSSAHSWFRPAERAMPSNLIAIGSTLGPVIAAPALAVVIASLGWRWAFGALGIIGAVWVLVWIFMGSDGPFGSKFAAKAGERVPDESPTNSDEPNDGGEVDRLAAFDSQHKVPWKALLLSGSFVVAVFAGFTNFWTQGFLTTWSPKYLAGAVNLSPELVALVFTFPWLFGAVVLLGLGVLGRSLMRKGHSVHKAIGVPFGISLAVAGLCFVLLPATSGTTSVVLLTIAAGCSVIYPMAPTAMAYAAGPKQRPVLMAVLGGVASVGAIVSPTAVGLFMDGAGYRTPAPGTKDTAEMIINMTAGVNQSFGVAGALLLLAGVLSVLFMNPDKTASRLQAKYPVPNV